MTTSKPGSRTAQARRLPAPVPGQEIGIPLDLLPIYLQTHRLEPMDRGEVRSVELKTRTAKTDGVLWVKRSTE